MRLYFRVCLFVVLELTILYVTTSQRGCANKGCLRLVLFAWSIWHRLAYPARRYLLRIVIYRYLQIVTLRLLLTSWPHDAEASRESAVLAALSALSVFVNECTCWNSPPSFIASGRLCVSRTPDEAGTCVINKVTCSWCCGALISL